jgi:hypothetical protein
MSENPLQIFYAHELKKFLDERSKCTPVEATVTGMGRLKGKWIV